MLSGSLLEISAELKCMLRYFLLLLLLLLFRILYCAPLSKNRKEKDCTTCDVEITCLTMEIQVYLIESKRNCLVS